MFEVFEQFNLHVVELPVTLTGDLPSYQGFLQELPFLSGEGHSRVEMYRDLLIKYQEYAAVEAEESSEEATTSLLSTADLLKYYDGETFDGFQLESLDD